MTLTELSDIAQAVGAVAILVSLAAVYGQVRQTNKIARAELTHSVWTISQQVHPAMYDTPEKAELMHRALFATGPLSEPERFRMGVNISTVMGMHEAAFTLLRQGLVEPHIYNTFEATVRLYTRRLIVQEWWSRFRDTGRDVAYVALIDGMIAQRTQSPPART